MLKKLRLIICLLLITSLIFSQGNDASKYATSSVLKEGNWIKLSVDKTGIYRLDYEDIKNLQLDPTGVRIHGYGGNLLDEDFSSNYIDDLPEVAIYMHKGADNVFNNGDYILFYAQANISWKYDPTKEIFTHTRNHYSDKGYYFITSKPGEGKRIVSSTPISGTPEQDITSSIDYMLYEKEIFNLANGGREFYGDEFYGQQNVVNCTFDAPNIDISRTAKCIVDIASKSTNSTVMSVFVNGNNIDNIDLNSKWNNSFQVAETTNKIINFTPNTGNNFSISLKYNSPTEYAYLNYIILNYHKRLNIYGDEFYFRNVDYLNENKLCRFILTGGSNNTEIWEITDPNNTSEIIASHQSNQLSFLAKPNNIKNFVAVNTEGIFPKPHIEGKINNQNLHALPNKDMIIIVHKDYLQEAEELASFHLLNDNITTNIVSEEQIFNEFSSGTPDATAYRRFAKIFYDRYKSGQSNIRPKWLLLIGDGIFDNRKIIPGSEKFGKLLTYQAYNSINQVRAYTTDDYFGYLDDNDSVSNPSSNLDIAVGRLPVYTKQQAQTVVRKSIEYARNQLHGDWKNTILFIADDGDNNIHMKDCDSVSIITQQRNNDILIKKLYLDAYKQEVNASTESYPLAENILDNYIKKGVLLINYMGHGSHIGWANEKILTTAKIKSMLNNKYPLFITATCDFSAFDQFAESGGEQLLWNNTGGTMALITTTRAVYTNANAELNEYLSKNLFDKDEIGIPLTIGEILKRAKNEQIGSVNKFSFTLLGDPALKLLYPYEAKVITDSINNKAIDMALFDTITSLSEITLSGHISTHFGDIINGYDGNLSISIFDKKEKITTLANDKDSHPFEYYDRPNPIFKGSADIKNGKWKFTFLVPKDIKYNFGTGRIVYYATENNQGMEANGSFENFVVGGENPNPKIDNQGPEVNLFMNSRNFREGQTVNTSPLFIADIYDDSGINTTGNGIGHDIILKKHREDKQEIVLNNYYISKENSYKSGSIEYQLDKLEEGEYNMHFRVWDLQNNSTNRDIHFIVSEKSKIDAMVQVYPNPATEIVNFVINHDRPYQKIHVNIRVYDIVGRTVWTSAIEDITSDNQTNIVWQIGENKRLVSKGVYFVNLEISSGNEKSVFKPIKLIVQ